MAEVARLRELSFAIQPPYTVIGSFHNYVANPKSGNI